MLARQNVLAPDHTVRDRLMFITFVPIGGTNKLLITMATPKDLSFANGSASTKIAGKRNIEINATF